MKLDAAQPGEIFLAKSGFGGTEYLLPALITEGQRRGLTMNRIAALISANPARRFGLRSKGNLAPGFDADIAWWRRASVTRFAPEIPSPRRDTRPSKVSS